MFHSEVFDVRRRDVIITKYTARLVQIIYTTCTILILVTVVRILQAPHFSLLDFKHLIIEGGVFTSSPQPMTTSLIQRPGVLPLAQALSLALLAQARASLAVARPSPQPRLRLHCLARQRAGVDNGVVRHDICHLDLRLHLPHYASL